MRLPCDPRTSTSTSTSTSLARLHLGIDDSVGRAGSDVIEMRKRVMTAAVSLTLEDRKGDNACPDKGFF